MPPAPAHPLLEAVGGIRRILRGPPADPHPLFRSETPGDATSAEGMLAVGRARILPSVLEIVGRSALADAGK